MKTVPIKDILKTGALATAFVLGLCGCAVHKTGSDQNSGEAGLTETKGSQISSPDLRGPLVLKLITQTQKQEKILEEAKKYPAFGQFKLAYERESIKCENLMSAKGYVYQSLGTLPQILNSIDNGNPVVVARQITEQISEPPAKENSELQLIVGAELRDEKLIFRTYEDGEKKLFKTSYENFFKSWAPTSYYAKAFIPISQVTSSLGKKAIDQVFLQALQMEEKSPLQARKIYRKLLAIDDDNVNAYIALSNNLLASGHRTSTKEAVSLLEQATALEPNRFELWYNLIYAQQKAGMPREAKLTSRKTIAMFQGYKGPKRALKDLRALAKR